MHDRRRHTMKTLITALALAAIIAAPSFTQPAAAAAAAHKAGRDVCQSGQNDKCYWRGYPLWQWYSSLSELLRQAVDGSYKFSTVCCLQHCQLRAASFGA
jgi:hypothetical protein